MKTKLPRLAQRTGRGIEKALASLAGMARTLSAAFRFRVSSHGLGIAGLLAVAATPVLHAQDTFTFRSSGYSSTIPRMNHWQPVLPPVIGGGTLNFGNGGNFGSGTLNFGGGGTNNPGSGTLIIGSSNWTTSSGSVTMSVPLDFGFLNYSGAIDISRFTIVNGANGFTLGTGVIHGMSLLSGDLPGPGASVGVFSSNNFGTAAGGTLVHSGGFGSSGSFNSFAILGDHGIGSFIVIPEPSTWALLLLGGAGLVLLRRRRVAGP